MAKNEARQAKDVNNVLVEPKKDTINVLLSSYIPYFTSHKPMTLFIAEEEPD